MLATSTSQPTYLALPYGKGLSSHGRLGAATRLMGGARLRIPSPPHPAACPAGISCLGWAGGMVTITVAAAITVYCNLLLVRAAAHAALPWLRCSPSQQVLVQSTAACLSNQPRPATSTGQAGGCGRAGQPHVPPAGAQGHGKRGVPGRHRLPVRCHRGRGGELSGTAEQGHWVGVCGSVHARAPLSRDHRCRLHPGTPAWLPPTCHPTLPAPACQIANLILAGQCLQSLYELYVTDGSVRNCAWQLIAGAGLLVLVMVRCRLPSALLCFAWRAGGALDRPRRLPGLCCCWVWLLGSRAHWLTCACACTSSTYSAAAVDGPHGTRDTGGWGPLCPSSSSTPLPPCCIPGAPARGGGA